MIGIVASHRFVYEQGCKKDREWLLICKFLENEENLFLRTNVRDKMLLVIG